MILIVVFLLAYFCPRFRSFLLDNNDDAVVSLPGAVAQITCGLAQLVGWSF